MKVIELRHLEENEANFAVNEIECLGFVTKSSVNSLNSKSSRMDLCFF
jgi:hypothetical protein